MSGCFFLGSGCFMCGVCNWVKRIYDMKFGIVFINIGI